MPDCPVADAIAPFVRYGIRLDAGCGLSSAVRERFVLRLRGIRHRRGVALESQAERDHGRAGRTVSAGTGKLGTFADFTRAAVHATRGGGDAAESAGRRRDDAAGSDARPREYDVQPSSSGSIRRERSGNDGRREGSGQGPEPRRVSAGGTGCATASGERRTSDSDDRIDTDTTPASPVHALILTATGAKEQRRFFDEIIPTLDAATASAIHVHALGDPRHSGDRYEQDVIIDRLLSDRDVLAEAWEAEVARRQHAGIALAHEIAAARSLFNIEIDDLPCIVFLTNDAGASERIILRIPDSLLESAAGRKVVERTLLAEFSEARLHESVGVRDPRDMTTPATRLAEHVRKVERTLATACGNDGTTPRTRTSRRSLSQPTQKETARRLGVGPRTLRNYIRRFATKFGRQPTFEELQVVRKEAAARNPVPPRAERSRRKPGR